MAACYYNLDVAVGLAYFLGVVNILQALINTIGNLIVAFIVTKNKRLRTRSNFCLMSLAATDLLVGIILEPLHIIQFFSAEHRNNCGLNTVRRYMASVFMGASIGSIAVISYDRYMHLSKTMNYRRHMSKLKIAALLLLSWLVPIIVPVIRFASEAAYKITIVLYIIFVLAVMVTCYVVIIRIVKKRERALKMNKTSKHHNDKTLSPKQSGSSATTSENISDDDEKSRVLQLKNHIKAAKAIMLIIAFLICTYAPLAFFHTVTAINSLLSKPSLLTPSAKEVAYAVLMTIGMANSTVNPIIYYLRIPEFRSSLKKYVISMSPRFFKARDSKADSRDSGTLGTSV